MDHAPAARRGPGRPKGAKNQTTYTKEAAREVLRHIVYAEMRAMTQAQIQAAKGLRYLVVRDKHGKWVRVTEAMARARLGRGEEVVEVWEKDPSTAAYATLMAHAIDRPKEQEQELVIRGDDELISRLEAARLAAARKKQRA